MVEFEVKKLENLMNSIISCCQERTDKEAKRFGLPYAEIEILKLLGQDRYATVTGLSSRLSVSKSRVTKLVGGLLKKGLIHITEDPKDARVKLFGLTAKGKDLLRDILQYETDLYNNLISGLRSEDRDMVLRSLDILLHGMERVKAIL
jgi:DNA-binding MarR family transcriptional regulator